VMRPSTMTASRPRCPHIRSHYPSECSNVGSPSAEFAEGLAPRVWDTSAAGGRAMDHVRQNGASQPTVALAGVV
jgi:hypothetical protein